MVWPMTELRKRTLDIALFTILATILAAVFLLLATSIFIQFGNYTNALEVAIEQQVSHTVLLSYLRALDFAFIKYTALCLGFLLVFVGALYLLRVNQAAYEISMSGGASSVSLQTASPGLVLATLGVTIVALTLYNKSLVSLDQPVGGQAPIAAASMDINSIMESIQFEYDSIRLTPGSLASIPSICQYLRENNHSEISIEGRGDGDQQREYELALGERRANAFSNVIRNSCNFNVVARSISYGEERPSERGNNESHLNISID